MTHLLAHLVFAVGLYKYLSWELNKPFEPTRQWPWLAVTGLLSITGLALSFLSTGGLGIGNFLLHAVGGGMASASTYEYLRCSLKLNFSLRLQFVGLFFFVSGFGVLNELAEYVAELSGYGIFSISSQDTWKDFVANTSGAILFWSILLIVRKFRNDK